MSEHWRNTYDAWKLASPYDDYDGPEPQEDPGTCRRCNGSGWIGVTASSGRYVGPGPVPEDARGFRDARCDGCGGAGQIFAEEPDDAAPAKQSAE